MSLLKPIPYDKEKLEKLTTSAAVAQQVQQDIAKIKQQKLQATNFFSKQQTQEEKKWLPWAVGGGLITVTLLGTAAWYLNKIPAGGKSSLTKSASRGKARDKK